MKKSCLAYCCITLLFLFSCLVGYASTVKSFSGDSYAYFGIAKDIYLNGGHYFDWGSAPGINLYYITYLYTYLIGAYTAGSPIAFFVVFNITEILLFLCSLYVFGYLTKFKDKINANTYMVLAPAFLSLWMVLNLWSNNDSSILFFSSNGFLFTDAIVIMLLGLLLNLIHHLNTKKNIPWLKFLTFLVFSYWFCSTNLKFNSGAMLNILGFIFLTYLFKSKLSLQQIAIDKVKHKKLSQNIKKPLAGNFFPVLNFKVFLLLSTVLVLLIGLGYVAFFMFETYSASARYFFLAKADSDNPFAVFIAFFAGILDNPIAFCVSMAYIIGILFGVYTWGKIFFARSAISIQFLSRYPLASFFSAFAAMSLIIIILTGLLQGGIYFWSRVAFRYFETSIIFGYIGISCFVIETFSIIRKYSLMSSLLILGFTAIYGIYNFISNYNIEYPHFALYSCIKNNQIKYNLQNGVGNYWVARPISAYGDKTYALKTVYPLDGNPLMVDAFWLNSLYQKMGMINYFAYSRNNDHEQEAALAHIKTMAPNMEFTTIECNNGGDKILLFDANSAKIVSAVMRQIQVNARSYFAITAYGFGQNLWKVVPWHHQYISNNHSFLYYGTMLTKTDQQINYSNNSDLSITISNFPAGNLPVLSSGYLHLSAGKFTTQLSYIADEPIILAVVNLQTGSAIKVWDLRATGGVEKTSDIEDFSLDTPTAAAIMVVSNSNVTPITIKSLKLSWDGF